MRKTKKKEERKQEGSPAWMTTYGDMMTLLLCFFVLLYSFSVLDEVKFQEIMSALQVSFLREEGVLETSPQPSITEDRLEAQDIIEKPPVDEFYEIYLEMKSYLEEYGLEEDIGIRYEKKGIVLELKEAVLFDSGRVELKPESKDLLGHITLILEKVPNKVTIEGHTDDVPINRPMYPSNWELSVVRATSVIRFLTEDMGMPPQRFVAAGYSEYAPIDTNETPEGRAQNRRVNIVISDEEMDKEE